MPEISPPSNESQVIDALLARARLNDPGARNELVALLYERFRRRARSLLRRERPGHTLATTDLMNEALARLTAHDALARAADRSSLYKAFAGAMKRVLVDHARRRNAAKREGAWRRAELDDFAEAAGVASQGDIWRLNEALRDLALDHQRSSEVLDLRFFGGLTMPEVADTLGLSLRMVERDARFGLAWLRDFFTSSPVEQTP